MRQVILTVLACGTLTGVIGCGAGGLSQEDMRRHAIRRPTEDGNASQQATALTTAESGGQDAAGNKGSTDQQDDPAVTQQAAATTSRSASGDSGAPVARNSNNAPSTPGPAASDGPKSSGNEPEVVEAAGVQLPRIHKPDQPLNVVERRQRTIDNLTKIGQAVDGYCQKNGGLFSRAICNPKGLPMLSWRVALLPYLGYQDLYNKFDLSEPWDSPRNKPLLQLMPPEYQSPERFDESTNYLVPVASFTPFSRTRGIGLRNIEDGMENTVIVLEADDVHAVPWTQPQDFALNMKTLQYQVGQLRQDGFFVVWGDGSVSRIKTDAGMANLKAIFSYDGGDVFSAHLVKAAPNAAPEIAAAPEDDGAAGTMTTGVAANPTGTSSQAAIRRSEVPARSSQRQNERIPVPDARSLDRARILVRDVFEEDYRNARSTKDQQALAKKMLQQVSELADDPAGQYMTLDIAIQIATQSGDSATAISAMEEMLTRFDLNPQEQLELEHDILQQLARRKDRGRGVNQTLLDQAVTLIDKALRAEQFDTAESLCKIALGAARQLDKDAAEGELERQMRTIQEARNAYRTIHRTIANLENADDPKANLDVGRYYCLIRDEWEKGLPMLAKGSHREFQRLAQAELRGPTDGRAQIELADGWWELADNDPAHRKAIRLHAARWYVRAAEQLPQGLLKVKAELRVEQAERDYGELRGADALAGQ